MSGIQIIWQTGLRTYVSSSLKSKVCHCQFTHICTQSQVKKKGYLPSIEAISMLNRCGEGLIGTVASPLMAKVRWMDL